MGRKAEWDGNKPFYESKPSINDWMMRRLGLPIVWGWLIAALAIVGYGIYDPNSEKAFKTAFELNEQGRVTTFGPGDYREGSHMSMVLEHQINSIAERIIRGSLDARRRHIVYLTHKKLVSLQFSHNK